MSTHNAEESGATRPEVDNDLEETPNIAVGALGLVGTMLDDVIETQDPVLAAGVKAVRAASAVRTGEEIVSRMPKAQEEDDLDDDFGPRGPGARGRRGF